MSIFEPLINRSKMDLVLDINGEHFEVVTNENSIFVNNSKIKFEVEKKSQDHFLLFINNVPVSVEIIDQKGKHFILKVNQKLVNIHVKSDMDRLLEKLGMDLRTETILNELDAPMPGTIIKINVTEGQEVKAGDPILILEAMKMENIIKSPADAIIKTILVKAGQNVQKGDRMVDF
jgi:biotin carboxyl carrier protein